MTEKMNFEKKEELTNSDWALVQNKLRKLDIAPLLDTLYPASQKMSEDGFLKNPSCKSKAIF